MNMAAISTPIVLTQGASTDDATSFTTSSVAAPAASLILLAVANGDSNNKAPDSVTGLDLTWALIGNVENNYVAGSVWAATTVAAASGTITLDYGTTEMDAAHWHVLAVPDAQSGIPQVAVYPTAGGTGQDQNPAWSLPDPLGTGAATLVLAAINSDVATLDAPGMVELGTKQVTTMTNLGSSVFFDAEGDVNVGFSTSAAAPRKVGVAIELAPSSVPLDTPQGFTFVADSTPGVVSITASWSSVTDAAGYEIQVDRLDGAQWSRVGTISTSSTSRVIGTDDGLSSGSTYRGRVRATP